MLRLNRTFTIMLLVTTVPAAYSQSAPSKVTVAGTSYNVLPQGRSMLRVDDLDGHMIGMGTRTGSVIAPQAGPGFDIVKGAIKEFMNPTSGAAPAAVDDPRAAQREAQLARLASATGSVAANPLGPAKLTVEFPAAGGAIVKGTSFGDITYSADGTEARAVQKTSSPITGDTTIALIADTKAATTPERARPLGW